MAHEDDARDAQWLAGGDIAALLAAYEPVTLARCIARLRGGLDAEDVAQDVRLRLLDEFGRGKAYPVPYRVVVHKVIDWTVADYFQGRSTGVRLPEGWEPAAGIDHAEEIVSRYWLVDLIAGLDGRAREVLELRYLRGLGHDQMSEELGIEPRRHRRPDL
jgi:RNA polymerase sigma factor (sigma-70 family)